MMNIDATNLVIGRLATCVAKKALQGERMIIVNAEKSVVTGSKKSVMKRYIRKAEMEVKGNPEKGPHFGRKPDRILRRAVRGMLPMHSQRGRDAFKKVEVFIGIPKEFKSEKFATVENATNQSKNYLYLGDVSKALGAKW